MIRSLTKSLCPTLIVVVFICLACFAGQSFAQEPAVESKPETTAEAEKEPVEKTFANDGERISLITKAVKRLVELQHDDGAWPYEGVYRVMNSERTERVIPVGYRIGGTSIVCSSLISAPIEDKSVVVDAVTKGVQMILKELEHPLMKPSKTNRYDVRIWGHIYALDIFCRIKDRDEYKEVTEKTSEWIPKLVEAVTFQEVENGGWNYANKRAHCCFVTGPAVQSLLLAKQAGFEVADEVLGRAAEILISSRKDEEAVIPYTGTNSTRDTQAGSVARAPVTEVTLTLLGRGDPERLEFTIECFHKHWDELEKRRKKTGTHARPHGIAPYYFYYAHRYAAQAIRMLPSTKQQSEFDKFVPVMLRTKDEDNTWNDRVFEQSKAYGTAMSLLALSRDSVQLPKSIKLKDAE